jgi:uncharacterized protein YcbK (DUF882 family)
LLTIHWNADPGGAIRGQDLAQQAPVRGNDHLKRVVQTTKRQRAAAPRRLHALVLAACAVLAVFSAAIIRPRAAGEPRTITFFNIHNKETTTIAFKRDGEFLPGALEKFNWAFRDWRKNEPTKMDPALLDLLWEIHTELGSKQPIHIISGYRSRGTNEALRSSVGGQASESRHILGKAADVHFPDVPLRALRYSALIRERGGVGYYPTSAIEFVHIDTDRVRHWPRLPRHELALLFPNGQSKHQPADGGSITLDDVRVAKSEHKDLARQVAAFYDSRNGRRPPVAIAGLDLNFSAAGATQVASAAPPPAPVAVPRPGTQPGVQVAALEPPRLVEPPRIVDRPSRFAVPTANEQARMNDLIQRASFTPPPASAQPQLVSPPALAQRPSAGVPAQPQAKAPPVPPELPPLPSTITVAQAPDFDEDHPEELSYRPFPIAPLMTLTASADDPALAIMIHPDMARTFDLLDQTGSVPPMRLRPGLRVAEAMFSQQFKGEAFNPNAWLEPASAGTALSNRKVKTQ